MSTLQNQTLSAMRPAPTRTNEAIVRGTVLTLSCVVSFWLTTHILARYSISRDDDALGGMWAVVATIFVYRESHTDSVRAALTRMAATCMSFALCFAYLLLFPFHVWGMAALIGISTIVLAIAGRSNESMTTGITTAVVMVVAALSPHNAWRQPILRLVDTAFGVAVGIVASWIASSVMPVLVNRDARRRVRF